MINIRNLCFGYNTVEVLHNINLDIDDGQFTVIVGPNGGGKTTLLKLILGLLTPVYGELSIQGLSPEGARHLMAYVPQQLLYDSLLPVTVMDVALMGRQSNHWLPWYSKDDRRVALSALERVGLSQEANRLFSELSGGQRQRCLIAQALAGKSQYLLLDEPGASLDPGHRLQLYSLLEELRHTSQITILLVSHNLNVVASYATHVLCINRTAELHPITEMSTQALSNGQWTQLNHHDCPVSNQDKAAIQSPHCGCHHHHETL